MNELEKTYVQSYNDWLDKHDEEIRAQSVRDFAEWLGRKHFLECKYCEVRYGCDIEGIPCTERIISYYNDVLNEHK